MSEHVPRARKHVYLPLNRFYKPLGMPNGDWVEYEKFTGHFLRFKMDPRKIDIWFPHPTHLYLYDERPASTDDYGERLHQMMRHTDNCWERRS
jgi:hypothetical protein